jgi:hypothetical protein
LGILNFYCNLGENGAVLVPAWTIKSELFFTDIEIMAIIIMNIKVKFNFTVLQINPRFRYSVSGKLEPIK